jgi:hypothetical protein
VIEQVLVSTELRSAIFDIINKTVEEGKLCSPNPADKLAEICCLEIEKSYFVSRIAHRLAQGMEFSFFLDRGWCRTMKFSRDKNTNKFVVYLSGVKPPEIADFVTNVVQFANQRLEQLYQVA